jgi:ABC-type multidrug transport system ATPase subunit
MTGPLCAADSIDLKLGGRQILRSAYVDAVPGAVTALVGRSGAGKTTLLNILAGLRRPNTGLVRWAGAPVERPRLWKLARLGLVFCPARPWLAPSLTLAEHLAMVGGPSPMLPIVGVGVAFAGRTATLSGGEMRLAELALALALEPKVLVCDEPFRGLEPRHRELIGAGLRGAAERGVAVLYADHDVRLVMDTADRLFSIENGMTRPVEGFKTRPLSEWYHAWPQ